MIVCEGISKRYQGRRVLESISLRFEKGRQYAIVGPSGAGKTTLARIIAGLEKCNEGMIERNGDRVLLCPQDFVVWPHLNVLDNATVGLKGVASARESVAVPWLSKLGIEGLKDRRTGDLSYGQQQRASLVRALAASPDLLILDEPFAHLDPQARRSSLREISDSLRGENVTTIWITHDAQDALSLADEITFLSGGQVAQQGEPGSLYENPKSREIAEFFGRISFVEASLALELSGLISKWKIAGEDTVAFYGIRPEMLVADYANGKGRGRIWKCSTTEYLGHSYQHEIEALEGVRLVASSRKPIDWSKPVSIELMQAPCEFTS